jgi:hypothetical protein
MRRRWHLAKASLVFSIIALPWGSLSLASATGRAVPSQEVAPEVEPSKAGASIFVGRVLFRGAIPPATQVQVSRDVAICGQTLDLQTISIDPTTGGLRNAIVHVDVGKTEAGTETSGELRDHVQPVRNKNCAFVPRVGVGRTGAEVEISNDDPIMHNTNVTAGTRTVLNIALVAGGTPIRKRFKNPGLQLVKCNVHKFMLGYRYVFDHAFFDITTEAGQFRIGDLPPGIHTVTVWHETLGTIQKEVNVPVRGIMTVDFEFK